uniref:Uncharacterized protein n=1 Tax=viral metagenome TaxID=1070528 RepID=A0A6M3KYW6_9ZZZZ
MAIQSLTRKQIRQSIGYNLLDMVLVTASTTGDTSSIIATYSLAKGGDDEYNGRQVYASDMTGSIVAGEKTWVSDFNSTNKDATVSPVFSASSTALDVFELWKVFTVEEINDAITQAEMEVSSRALQSKIITTPFTETDKYLYDVLDDFTHLSKVEYVCSKGIYHLLDNCDAVWTAGSANVTVTADSSFEKVGTACVKAVEGGGSGAGAILAYKAITSVDLSGCDKVEFWMYSSIALTAGQLEIHLDDTAAIASGIEKIDIPAMDAATWYKHSLSLASPHLDTAIISIGIYQVSDVGAFTFYVDDVSTCMSTSKQYKLLSNEYWNIAKGSTPYLQLTSGGLSEVGTNTQMKLTGYQLLTPMSADSSESQVDPGYLVNKVTGELLLNHAKSSYLDINDRAALSDRRLAKARADLPSISTQMDSEAKII